jgi:hypothetical protein
MKGQLPLTIGIIGMIFTITAIMIIGFTLIFLKYHLSINLKQEYDYNNGQLTLLSLISSKYDETRSIYRILSERNTNGFDENMRGKIESDLELLTKSKCFKIVNDTATILEKHDCTATKNVGEIYIFRPYGDGKLVEKLILVYE